MGWVLSYKVSTYHLRSHNRQRYTSQHMALLSFHVILPQCLLWSLDNLLLVSQARRVPASECLCTLFSLLEKRISHFLLDNLNRITLGFCLNASFSRILLPLSNEVSVLCILTVNFSFTTLPW